MEIVTFRNRHIDESNPPTLLSISWQNFKYQYCGNDESKDVTEKLRQSWNWGGFNQLQRAEAEEYVDKAMGEVKELSTTDKLKQLSEVLLFSLFNNGILNGYIYGIFPFFTINLYSVPIEISLVSRQKYHTEVLAEVVKDEISSFLCVWPVQQSSAQSNQHDLVQTVMQSPEEVKETYRINYQYIELAAAAQLNVESCLGKLQVIKLYSLINYIMCTN